MIRPAPDERRPTLADVAMAPQLARELSPALCAAFLVQASAVVAACGARMADLAVDDEDRALTVEEAAAMLRLATVTLYRKAKHEPRWQALTVDYGADAQMLRFSRRKIQAFLSGRKLR